MKEICLERSIWPDIDGPDEVNNFLKRLQIKVSFLLDSGISFQYPPDSLEPYQIGNGTLYFKDPVTKENLFHYYEGIGELVFEDLITNKSFRIPIYEEENFKLARD